MGNAIKNFEKKMRKAQKEDFRKMQIIIHNEIMRKYPIPDKLKEKEMEIFSSLF